MAPNREDTYDKVPLVVPLADDYCFVCGRDNPLGLHLQVRYMPEARAAAANLTLPREYQGWADVIHGGILATLLDEMMAQAVWKFAGPCITLSLEVRFHHPLKPGEEISVRGLLTSPDGSRRTAQAEIRRTRDNQRIASGKSKFLLVNEGVEGTGGGPQGPPSATTFC